MIPILLGILAVFVAGIGLHGMMGKRRKDVVDVAVRSVRKRLIGRAVPTIDANIKEVFWYGAVDIAAQHCVVWILVEGLQSEQVPAWLTLQRDGSLPPGKPLDAELASWMRDIHGEVLAAFREAGWRSGELPTIGFESSERVNAGGGWVYFK